MLQIYNSITRKSNIINSVEDIDLLKTEEFFEISIERHVISPDSLELLKHLMHKLTSLHTLDLSRNNLGQHAPAVAAALAESTSLHTLDLSGNQLGQHAPAVAAALANSTSLHTLNLKNNNLEKDGPAVAAELVKSLFLETLNLSHNNLRQDAIAVAAELVKSTSLHTLNLSDNNLEKDGPAVAAELVKSTSLHTLNLGGNSLKQYGPSVAAELVKSTSLHTLNLGDNILGQYAIAVAAALAKSTSLHTLNLRDNYLEQYGPAVAKALVKSLFLETLNLHWNNLEKDATAVAAALAKSTSLHTLDLSGHNFGQDAILVAKELAKSTSLHILNWGCVDLGQDAPAVAAEIAKSTSLLTLVVMKDHMTIYPELRAALAKNRAAFAAKFPTSEEDASEQSPEENGASAAPALTDIASAQEDEPAGAREIMPHAQPIRESPFADLVFLIHNPEMLPKIFGRNAGAVEKYYLDPKYFAKTFFPTYGVCRGLPGEATITKDSDGNDLEVHLTRRELPPEIWHHICSYLSIYNFPIGSPLQQAPQIEEVDPDIDLVGADAAS